MGKKKIVKKGKKKHVNKPTSKKYSKYKVEGDKLTKERFCPRCGPGVFLMKTKDRVYCGRCHYAEFEGKPVKAEEKKK
jgi:small subunit ribosomal protein S27Ae